MKEAIKFFIRMRPRLQNEDEEAWKIQKESNSIMSLPRDPQTTRRFGKIYIILGDQGNSGLLPYTLLD